MSRGSATSAYRHPGYAASLAEFGTPRHLRRSGGWLLERPIDGTPYHDAMWCYPLFSCTDWSEVKSDVDDLADDLVSISLVTDPFGDYDEARLRTTFSDKCLPFKEHFVADLREPARRSVRPHHRYYALRALRTVAVERCDEPGRFVGQWMLLYQTLIARHQIQGIKAFSRAAFQAQLSVPGIVVLQATHQGELVGAHLWYVQDDVAHSHLMALSPRGYELMASYALYWVALRTFGDQVRWLNLGAGAGVGSGVRDGLARFKRGWATETRTTYFCGRIFDRRKYAEALAARGWSDNGYFPAYRMGDFT